MRRLGTWLVSCPLVLIAATPAITQEPPPPPVITVDGPKGPNIFVLNGEYSDQDRLLSWTFTHSRPERMTVTTNVAGEALEGLVVLKLTNQATNQVTVWLNGCIPQVVAGTDGAIGITVTSPSVEKSIIRLVTVVNPLPTFAADAPIQNKADPIIVRAGDHLTGATFFVHGNGILPPGCAENLQVDIAGPAWLSVLISPALNHSFHQRLLSFSGQPDIGDIGLHQVDILLTDDAGQGLARPMFIRVVRP